MRTHPKHLRKGVAAEILEHLLNTARDRKYRMVSLETGSGPSFQAAVSLYSRFGFIQGGVFGDYTATSFNQFFHLDLYAPAEGVGEESAEGKNPLEQIK